MSRRQRGNLYIYIHVYIYIHSIYVCVGLHTIYIYIVRERERERQRAHHDTKVIMVEGLGFKTLVHTHFVSNFAETVVCKRHGRKEVDIRYWIQVGVFQCVLQCALQYVATCCRQGDIGYQNHGGVL